MSRKQLRNKNFSLTREAAELDRHMLSQESVAETSSEDKMRKSALDVTFSGSDCVSSNELPTQANLNTNSSEGSSTTYQERLQILREQHVISITKQTENRNPLQRTVAQAILSHKGSKPGKVSSKQSSRDGQSEITATTKKTTDTDDELKQELEDVVLGNLTPKERQQLEEIQLQLSKLTLPETPPDAFTIFLTSQGEVQPEEIATDAGASIAISNAEAKKKWQTMSREAKAEFEEKSSLLFAEYQKEYERINKESQRLWSLHDSIRAKGDMEHRIQVKRISPFRIYKRETAAEIKSEFPSMSNEERSQIVKERWRTISTKKKEIFVYLARIEEERLSHQAIQDFYCERIATARAHAGQEPLPPGKLFPLRDDKTVQQSNRARDSSKESEKEFTFQMNSKSIGVSDTEDGDVPDEPVSSPKNQSLPNAKSTTTSISDESESGLAALSSKNDSAIDSKLPEIDGSTKGAVSNF